MENLKATVVPNKNILSPRMLKIEEKEAKVKQNEESSSSKIADVKYWMIAMQSTGQKVHD